MHFILDTHLGKLAAYLRMLGLDTAYCTDYPDDELARISVDEKRILLTRDRGPLKRDIIMVSPRDNELNRRDVARVEKLWNSTALYMKDIKERLCAEEFCAGR